MRSTRARSLVICELFTTPWTKAARPFSLRASRRKRTTRTLALNPWNFSRKMPAHPNGRIFFHFTPQLAAQSGLPLFLFAQAGGRSPGGAHHRRDRGHPLRIDLRCEGGPRLCLRRPLVQHLASPSRLESHRLGAITLALEK